MKIRIELTTIELADLASRMLKTHGEDELLAVFREFVEHGNLKAEVREFIGDSPRTKK